MPYPREYKDVPLAKILKANKDKIAEQLKAMLKKVPEYEEEYAKLVARFIAGGIYDEGYVRETNEELQVDFGFYVLDLGYYKPEEVPIEVLDMILRKSQPGETFRKYTGEKGGHIILKITNPNTHEIIGVVIYPVDEEDMTPKEHEKYLDTLGAILQELWNVRYVGHRGGYDYDEWIFDYNGKEVILYSGFDEENGMYILGVIVEGAVDFEEYYSTLKEGKQILKTIKAQYPELRTYIDELIGL